MLDRVSRTYFGGFRQTVCPSFVHPQRWTNSTPTSLPKESVAWAVGQHRVRGEICGCIQREGRGPRRPTRPRAPRPACRAQCFCRVRCACALLRGRSRRPIRRPLRTWRRHLLRCPVTRSGKRASHSRLRGSAGWARRPPPRSRCGWVATGGRSTVSRPRAHERRPFFSPSVPGSASQCHQPLAFHNVPASPPQPLTVGTHPVSRTLCFFFVCGVCFFQTRPPPPLRLPPPHPPAGGCGAPT